MNKLMAMIFSVALLGSMGVAQSPGAGSGSGQGSSGTSQNSTSTNDHAASGGGALDATGSGSGSDSNQNRTKASSAGKKRHIKHPKSGQVVVSPRNQPQRVLRNRSSRDLLDWDCAFRCWAWLPSVARPRLLLISAGG